MAWSVFRGLVAATAIVLPWEAMADDPHARQVLAEAKAATGGAAWDRITQWHEVGRHGDTDYVTDLDFTHEGMISVSTRPGGTTTEAFNGAVIWELSRGGRMTVSRAVARVEDARQSYYGSIFGFFLPDRFPAAMTYAGERDEDGARFDVVHIEPEGAKPMEVWVDRASHRIARFVDPTTSPPTVAAMSDYRKVGDVEVPFAISISDGDPAHVQTAEVASIILEPIARSRFDPPGLQ